MYILNVRAEWLCASVSCARERGSLRGAGTNYPARLASRSRGRRESLESSLRPFRRFARASARIVQYSVGLFREIPGTTSWLVAIASWPYVDGGEQWHAPRSIGEGSNVARRCGRGSSARTIDSFEIISLSLSLFPLSLTLSLPFMANGAFSVIADSQIFFVSRR